MIDILMITHNRPEYVRLALPHLLESCPPHARVWVWHNGTDDATLRAVLAYRDHPRLHRFHHSPVNTGLRTPTNWLWQEATGEYLGKVDDDCMPDPAYLRILPAAHADNPRFGVIGCWRFPDSDVEEELVAKKLADYPGGHRLMRNHWVQGSGYLVKRAVLDELGPLRPEESFTGWCLRAARAGWINGWYHPFLHEEHMDDPRSPYTIYRTDADLQHRLPLSARNTGCRTVAEWTDHMRDAALVVQRAPLDLRAYEGWRWRVRNIGRRIRLGIGARAPW